MEETSIIPTSTGLNMLNGSLSRPNQTQIVEPQPQWDSDQLQTAKPTIRQIREAMISPNPANNSTFSPPPPPLPTHLQQKKRSSFFGALFTKEPTQVALGQVTAQILAQHGSTSATRVPNVRMEKMPQHVPRVNSKWDGLPEAVKLKEQQEKDTLRSSKRQSLTYSARSHSADSVGHRKSYKNQGSRESNSQNSSFQSQFNSSSSDTSHSNDKSTRFYAQSVNSSADLVSQQRTKRPASMARPHSFGTPSQTKSTEIRDYAAGQGHDLSHKPAKSCSSINKVSVDSISADRHRSPRHKITAFEPVPTIEAVPEYSTSPVTTPRERSPVTPSQGFPMTRQLRDRDELRISQPSEAVLLSSGSDVLGRPATTRKKTNTVRNSAFLAGEAQEFELPDDDIETSPHVMTPLEQFRDSHSSWSRHHKRPSDSIDRVMEDVQKRPDSSRTRLGLRASMVVRSNLLPWENRDLDEIADQSPKSAVSSSIPTPSSKRSAPRSLSRLGKEADQQP